MSSYCDYAPEHPIHGPYHDEEYGYPIGEESALFERLSLEIFQAGLSWLIVLKKRSAIYSAFDAFDVDRVAKFDQAAINRLLDDANIIRNRRKIEAIILNAQQVLSLRHSHDGFAKWIASHHPLPLEEWTKLFRKTFRFMGPEIVNEFLMSIGYLPGAHRNDCAVFSRIAKKEPPWMNGQSQI
jgi:DNA-3-methyladenine glycosylase I